MPSVSLLLDVLTLFFVLSYALSAVTGLPLLAVRQSALSAREARRMLLFPPVGALAMVALGFWPGVRSALGGQPDHCELLDAHHPHLCWYHGVVGQPHGPSHDVLALAVLGLVLAIALWQVFRWGQGYGRLRLLESVATPEREGAVRQRLTRLDLQWPGPLTVVSFDQPLCFVAGAIQPRLVVSTSVVKAMTDDEMRVMIAHELAHVERRDNAWRLFGQAALLFHLPGLGHRAMGRWHHAAEVACDDVAAVRVGSRLAVAEALVRFQRLLQQRGRVSPLGMAFGHAGALELRVRRLLDPPVGSSPWWVAAWPWALLLLVGSLADGLHEFLESGLSLLHF